jgi:hypothetical protein
MMGERQHNVVVINGKHYSVDTGELLTHSSGIASAQSTPAVTRLTPKAPTDLRHPAQKVERHPNHTDLRKAAAKATAHKQVDPMSRHAADGITSQRPKSIKTHRPAAAVHSKLKTPDTHHERAKQPHLPKISHISSRHQPIVKHHQAKASTGTHIDLGSAHHEARRLRAAQHRKHEQISKFAAARRKTATPTSAPQLTEHKAIKLDGVVPKHPKAVAAAAALADHPPVAQRLTEEQQALHRAVAAHHPRHSKAHRHHQPSRHEVTAQQEQIAAEERQDQESKQTFFQRFAIKQSFASTVAISLTILVVVGYVTYLNIPNVAMRVAASRAGFDATLPAYTPDGFGFEGPIAYNSGQVVVDFSSNTDKRNYSIAQKKSNWDSKSLLENKVKNETDNYLTFQDKGLTIYVYDGTNATWVNRGIWYTIEGDSKLNTEQLLKIATSL